MSERPNILVLMCDQLRRDALSIHGDVNLQTPHIDGLATRGVRFSNACSTYPICVPFRFTFMTGEYAHSRKVPGIEYRMSPTEYTLADAFNEAGYETVYVGKWHLDGGHGRMGSALECGRTPVPRAYQGRWEKWFGFELRNAPFDTYYFEDDDPTPMPIGGYQTDGLYDIGMNYLASERDSTRPFCMVISVEPPHDPFEAPPDIQAAWEAREIELPPNFEASDAARSEAFLLDRKRYYAMVENLDGNVKRMMDFLRRGAGPGGEYRCDVCLGPRRTGRQPRSEREAVAVRGVRGHSRDNLRPPVFQVVRVPPSRIRSARRIFSRRCWVWRG